ncbi:glycosyltransferase family 39 protein [Streptantibioticus cattleyicolor]|uniref:Mannosyltransferase n=1 Tax=Streptantibioticus cattleyicolor (strain ATCC 35852 / DSM 46488 / JCM 4925 / NBRC 14057 / NRRL 8057) TaxID=1003195 RepID=F8JIY8_STREN|nr:glycosyltransferase family 39 protein [Streptantibioticus cattleyicolor]AEW98926.1 hypothetical protein SCATT_p07330 [Streptantibioticus cattleyicolor NRRL 8057 = DSM 46488]CCB72028.1 conserved membrane protein of unknown function [Streptantibioticus cattleyicolor NRRL 8057 = DSM 46488]
MVTLRAETGAPVTAGPGTRWTAPRRAGRAAWWPRAAPAVLALAIGLWGIDRHGSVWRDEAASYEVARRSLAEIWHMLGSVDAVHGLYYLLLHCLFTVFPGGLVALRLPSVLAIAAAATGTAALGRRLAGPRVGLAAGLVFPVIPEVQRYAQEGRSYALVCAVVVAATHLLLRAVAANSPLRWAGYSVTVLVACLLHEFAVLALLAHGVTLAVTRTPFRALRAWGVAVAVAAAGLAPLAAVSCRQSAQVAWIPPVGPRGLLGFATLALTGLGCALVARGVKGIGRLCAVALPLLLVPPAALLLVSLLDRVYVGRYVFYAEVGLALLLGAAVEAVRRIAVRRGVPRGWPVAVVAATALALLPYSVRLRTAQSRTDDVAAAARVVRQYAAPGAGVLFIPAERRESAVAFPRDYRGVADLALDRDAVTSGTLVGTEVPAGAIGERMRATSRVITVTDPAARPGPGDTPQDAAKWRALRHDFEPCDRSRVPGLVVTEYVRRGACRPAFPHRTRARGPEPRARRR